MKEMMALVLASAFVWYSCTNDVNTADADAHPYLALTFEMEQSSFKDDSCYDQLYCTTASFEHPNFAEGSCIERCRLLVDSFILEAPYTQESTKLKASTEDVAREFITDFRSIERDFGGTSSVYEMNRSAIVQYQSESHVCLLFSTYMYTGGAHGNSVLQFMNVRNSDCSILKWEDIFVGWTADSLSEWLSQTYLEENGAKNLSLFEAGLNVEKLPVTNNFGLVEDRIVFLYNSYEVASYATGAVQVEVPYPAAFVEASAF